MILAASARGVSGVPVRSRPLIKPWIGPVPPPRLSPPRTLGDLLPRACLGDGGSSPEFCGHPQLSGQPGRAVSTLVVADPASAAASGTQVYPVRPLRMVDLGRWLRHMWNRKAQRVNPNFDRTFAAVVASPKMMRGDPSVPPGITTGQQALQPPASSQPVSSPTGGAPGFTPGVYQPVQAPQPYGTPGGFVPAQQPQIQQQPMQQPTTYQPHFQQPFFAVPGQYMHQQPFLLQPLPGYMQQQ